MGVFHQRWEQRAAQLRKELEDRENTDGYGLPGRRDIDLLLGARTWSIIGVAVTVFTGAVLILFIQPAQVLWYFVFAAFPQLLWWGFWYVRRAA